MFESGVVLEAGHTGVVLYVGAVEKPRIRTRSILYHLGMQKGWNLSNDKIISMLQGTTAPDSSLNSAISASENLLHANLTIA